MDLAYDLDDTNAFLIVFGTCDLNFFNKMIRCWKIHWNIAAFIAFTFLICFVLLSL